MFVWVTREMGAGEWFSRNSSHWSMVQPVTFTALMFMCLKEMRIYLIIQDWSDVDEYGRLRSPFNFAPNFMEDTVCVFAIKSVWILLSVNLLILDVKILVKTKIARFFSKFIDDALTWFKKTPRKVNLVVKNDGSFDSVHSTICTTFVSMMSKRWSKIAGDFKGGSI